MAEIILKDADVTVDGNNLSAFVRSLRLTYGSESEDNMSRMSLSSPADEEIDTGSVHHGPEDGIALCFSGGGYRAMLFHLGSVWRLYE